VQSTASTLVYINNGNKPTCCISSGPGNTAQAACQSNGIQTTRANAYGSPGPTAPPPATPPVINAGDPPCFAATTTACKILLRTATVEEAYSQCYQDAPGDSAALVRMPALSAGDIVLTADTEGTLLFERVVVNQHKGNMRSSQLIELQHSSGVLTLTPDHILIVDGKFAPARDATPGSSLRLAGGNPAIVNRVTNLYGTIINPVTASGTILAAGLTGEPVVAATHPEWSAAFTMETKAPFPLFYTLSAVFPVKTQAYYEAILEPLFDALGQYLQPAALASSALVLPLYTADAAAALGLAVFAFTSVLRCPGGLASGIAVAGGAFADSACV